MGYNWYRLTMKKSLITLLFMLFYIIVYGQETVGTFNMEYFAEEGVKKIECTNPDANDFNVYIGAVGNHASDEVYLRIKGNDLDNFKIAFIQLRDKFVEWATVARENNVTDMVKEFDISLPKMTVCWLSSKWWFSFNQRLTPKFLVLKDGKCAMVLSKKVNASSNEYIDQTLYFVLTSKEEFDDVLGLLDIQKMKDVFSKKESKEDLFH